MGINSAFKGLISVSYKSPFFRNSLETPFNLRLISVFVFGATTPQWAKASSFTVFLDYT